MSQGERRLAAIMFTDIVGYTALTQADEGRTMELLEEHKEVLRPMFARFHGREVKTVGDSFLVEFDSALEALRCATEIQSALHERNVRSPADRRVRLRIGIHLGDVIHKGGDVFGDAVNISSRIEPLAEPEGVCISRQVYDQVRNKFDLPLVSMGEKELKNVENPTEVFRVMMPWNQKPEAAPPPERRRVAVLPFSNMSPDPNDEFFADGMTEELISTVSRIEGAEVISRTSVMQYKKAPKPIREISRELDVGTVLEGSVRKAGNRVRVTVQMIDASRDRHLWAESYDRNMDDVFAIQSDIAGRVADALRARVASDPLRQASTESVEAHTLYMRAVSLFDEGTPESLTGAIDLLTKATALDPAYGKAFALMAEAWRHLAYFTDYAESLKKGEEAARKALEVAPDLAESHAAMASIHTANDRFEECRAEMEAAIRLNPNLSAGYRVLAEVSGAFGDLQASEGYFRRAAALDPLSWLNVLHLAQVLLLEGKADEAFRLLEHQKELFPRNPMVRISLVGACLQTRDLPRALQELEAGERADPKNPLLAGVRAIYLALAGEREEAEAQIAKLASENVSSTILDDVKLSVYSIIGDYDRAFAALDRLADMHAWSFLIKSDPFLAGLRKDPRFAQFCLRVGIPPP